MSQHHPQIEPANVTMRTGCAFTGDSRSTMYEAIRKGEVEAVKEGRRTLLVFSSLKKRVAARKPAVIGAGDPKFRDLRTLANTTRRKRTKTKKGA
jgi:hypothetical protein